MTLTAELRMAGAPSPKRAGNQSYHFQQEEQKWCLPDGCTIYPHSTSVFFFFPQVCTQKYLGEFFNETVDHLWGERKKIGK